MKLSDAFAVLGLKLGEKDPTRIRTAYRQQLLQDWNGLDSQSCVVVVNGDLCQGCILYVYTDTHVTYTVIYNAYIIYTQW